MMLARRRRRTEHNGHHNKNSDDNSDPMEARARALVEKEIAQWKCRIDQLRADNAAQRRYYKQQERELYAILRVAVQKLEQRRSTLLATTSLMPYAQCLQQGTVYRVPAPVLTLQAKLCLHVHCICVHEELLLRTKEQGWDVITWLEAVEQKLATIRREQVCKWWAELNEWVLALQEIENELARDRNIEIEETVVVADNHASDGQNKEKSLPDNNLEQKDFAEETLSPQLVPDEVLQVWKIYQTEATMLRPTSSDKYDHAAATTSTTTEDMLQNLPREGGNQDEETYRARNANLDKSFSEFLVKYQRKKELQQHVAERRQQHQGFQHTANPYTSKRAGVANKLKLYATRLFQSESHMDDSFQDFITGNNANNDDSMGDFAAANSTSSGSGLQQPRRWVKGIQTVASKGRNLVMDHALHRSENNLDWPSLHNRMRAKSNNRRSNAGSTNIHDQEQQEEQAGGSGNVDDSSGQKTTEPPDEQSPRHVSFDNNKGDVKNSHKYSANSENADDEGKDDGSASSPANEQRRWKRWVHKLNQSSRF